SAFGNNARAQNANATAVGSNAWASQASTTALGSNAQSLGLQSTSVGHSAQAHSQGAIAIGFNAFVGPAASGSVALGWGARATDANVFSVGNGGGSGTVGPATRRITNVSDGIADSDAATVGQVNAVADVAEHTDRYFRADGLDDGSDDASVS